MCALFSNYASFYLIVLKNVSLVTYYLPGSRVWYTVDHWEYRSIVQGDLRLIQSKSIGRPIRVFTRKFASYPGSVNMF